MDYISRFDASDFPTKFAAQIKDFDVGDLVDKKNARRYDDCLSYTMVASKKVRRECTALRLAQAAAGSRNWLETELTCLLPFRRHCKRPAWRRAPTLTATAAWTRRAWVCWWAAAWVASQVGRACKGSILRWLGGWCGRLLAGACLPPYWQLGLFMAVQ